MGNGSAVRISEAARRGLDELFVQVGETRKAILEKAIEAYRRIVFFEGLKKDFDRLRSDSQAWEEEVEERREWESAALVDKAEGE